MNAIPQPDSPAPGSNPVTRWTVQAVLDWTTRHLAEHGSQSPRLDAEILLAQSRGCQRIELYTQYDQELTTEQRAVMRDLVKRRANQEPVAYLVGHREFFGIDFAVDPHTLVPRPDTETLIVELLDLARELPTPPTILDVGTGSGCIAITLATQLPNALLTAVDISPAALAVAKANAATHDVASRMTFLAGDLFAPLEPTTRFHFIASNPPYVTSEELSQLPHDIRDHEPHTALDGGADGLDIIRRLLITAPDHLVPGGSLLCEISPEQSTRVIELLAEQPAFEPGRIVEDLAGNARVVVAATRPTH
ncbi:MAG TPA: peptide chain release factor N(5)-glutamine methyltransferase [Planctomycetaceae bacterium]|nr:peptide chain release factor N(5)-glutamine methyltransferase [Planctomycetaceae bacterium]